MRRTLSPSTSPAPDSANFPLSSRIPDHPPISMPPLLLRRSLRLQTGACAAALVAGLLIAGCGKAPNAVQAAPGPLAVGVITVQPEAVTLSQELPGRLSAYRIAEVRARISGIVQKRLFNEGADVKQGDVLFEIDPAPYEAAVDSARALLARAEASLASANAQTERFKGLVATHAVSRQNYDDALASSLSAAADVAAGRAALRTAEIGRASCRERV